MNMYLDDIILIVGVAFGFFVMWFANHIMNKVLAENKSDINKNDK